MTIRPRRLTVVCRLTAAAVVCAFALLAVLLPERPDGSRLGWGDRLAFLGFGVLLAAGVLAFTRFRVRADESGLWVRNVLAERRYPWGVVVGIQLPDGAPWAQLVLHDDQVVSLLALQSHDRAAPEAVAALRALHGRATRT